MKRVCRKTPNINVHKLRDFKKFVSDFVRCKLDPVHIMSFEEWLSSTSYNESRKDQLRACLRENKGLPTLKKCSHVDSFIKTESYCEYKHARFINSRCDAFKVASGPAFKTIEQKVYDLKNDLDPLVPYFIKHTPVVERPAVIARLAKPGFRYFMTDFTAFESHFCPEVMEACELILYRHMLSLYPSLSELICKTLPGVNKMRTRSGIRASCKGRRMSGDMCTSLGNGFTNLMLALYLAHKRDERILAVVEGDDGIFCSPSPITKSDYESLGFTIKIEEVSSPCEGSFCGMIFSNSGEIIRDPVKFLANFGWTSSFITAGNVIMQQLLRAKALSVCYETPQCPIVGAVARMALGLTRGVLPRFVHDGYHEQPKDETKLARFDPSHDTRVLFERKFGVSISTQLLIESMVLSGNFDIVHYLNVHPHYDHFATRYVGVG